MRTIESLFKIEKGHQLALNRVTRIVEQPDAIAYVSRSHRNHGVAAWVKRINGLDPADAGDVSVCLRSRNHTLSAFVQPRRFYTTYHVAILKPRVPMTLQEKLWWCLCIRANRFRFSFGRQANRTLGSLVLPDEIPAWATAAHLPSHEARTRDLTNTPVDTSDWGSFRLLDLFTPTVGLFSERRTLGTGLTPFVSASAWNNGISALVGVQPTWQGGQITLAHNGSIGAAFYQPRPFTASRDVTILEPKTPISAAAALFVCAILRKESDRFNYARKWTAARMRESTVRLPSRRGNPDWVAMADYMTSLPLGWALQPRP